MTLALTDCVLVLRPDDDVGVATRDLQSGTELDTLVVAQSVPRGHKLAVRAVAAGAPVHKYGQSIGRATRDIAVGDHVHSHNLGMDDDERAYEFGTARVTLPTPPGTAADLRRVRAQRRPVGHPQLRRHRHLGELLGVHRPADRRPVPRPRARRLPARRRGRRAHPRHRLRPGADERGRADHAAHPARVRRPPQHRRACWCSGSAAR